MRNTPILGGLSWLAALALLQPNWPIAILLLAALVLVPLALELVDEARPWILWPALPLIVACGLEPGHLAAAFSLPWLCATAWIALAGRRRLLRAAALGDVAIAFGMLYLVVGGGWTVLARFGARPLNFSGVIVGATAVHFHYAGFVLPILTGLSARHTPGRSARLACLGVVTGVPLVAVGITLSVFTATIFEALAAWLLVATCWLVAVRQLHEAAHAPVEAAWLLALSAVALVVGISFAAVYAYGQLAGIEALSIPLMYRLHGAVNAFGFALPGLLGWHLRQRAESFDTPQETCVHEEVLL